MDNKEIKIYFDKYKAGVDQLVALAQKVAIEKKDMRLMKMAEVRKNNVIELHKFLSVNYKGWSE